MSGRTVSIARELPFWERALFIARFQRGRVSRVQLFEAGLSRGVIDRLIVKRALVIVHTGVYSVGHELAPVFGDEVAALLAVGPPVALSCGSAGFVCRFWPSAPREVAVSVPGGRCRSRAGIRVHRCRCLTAADVMIRLLPVTTPARTLLDLAEDEEPRVVERAFDQALALRLISRSKIRAVIARNPGRKGRGLLAELADPARATGVTRDAAEERLLGLIRQAGLPDPERNVPVGPYVVDMLWAASGVVVEVDSFEWHSGPAVFKRDRRKHAFLTDRGHAVYRVTWEMMDDPLPLIARLARATADDRAPVSRA